MSVLSFQQLINHHRYFGLTAAFWTDCQLQIATTTQTVTVVLPAWYSFAQLTTLNQQLAAINWKINYLANAHLITVLSTAQTWINQVYASKKPATVCPFQVTKITTNRWLVTAPNPQLKLTAFARFVQTQLQQFGYQITVAPAPTLDRKTQILAEQQQYRQLFRNQPTTAPAIMLNPLINSKPKTFQGKIIALFFQKHRKQPRFLATVENQQGVYNLAVARTSLNLNQFNQFQLGSWWKFTGIWQKHHYEIQQLTAIEPQIHRFDNASQKRIEFHVHTKMSALDGIGSLEEYFQYASAWNHPAIAITDHENVHSFADCSRLQAKFPNLKIIYGCEFNYVVPNHYQLVLNPVSNAIPLTEQELVFFDLETTGLIPEYHQIIEFAAVIIQNGLIKEKINFFIQTTQPITPSIWALTQIDPVKYAAQAIDLATAWQRIRQCLANRILVAHNARFDAAFLQVLYRHFNQTLTNPIIDTLRLSHIVNPLFKRHNLQALARKFRITFEAKQLHRAIYDAKLLGTVFSRLIQKGGYTTLTALTTLNHDEQLLKRAFPYHLNLLVKNQAGLKALYQLVSHTHTNTLFYQRPVLLKADLNSVRQHFLVGAGCYNSEVFQMALNGTDAELISTMQAYDYIEIQPLEVYEHLIQKNTITQSELIWLIQRIIKLAKIAKVMVIASGDVHYVNPEDRIYRDVLVSNKMLGGRRHPLFQAQGTKPLKTPLQYFRTTNEMKTAFQFLTDPSLIHELVVLNPQRLNQQIAPVKCFALPTELPVIKQADQTLQQLAQQRLKAKYGSKIDPQVQQRFDQELVKIIESGYATIYLIAYQLTNYSLANGFLFSSRGSVGSSFLAYCLDITEVNPLPPHAVCRNCFYFEWAVNPPTTIGFDLAVKDCPNCQTQLFNDGTNIIFESFLGLGRVVKPDIDLNFSSWFQEKAQQFVINYLTEQFGAKHVFRAGTISTLANKSAYNLYCNYLESEHADQPERLRFGQKEQIIYYCTGIKRTTGQHPGGLMIIPPNREIYDYCPFNYPSNNPIGKVFTTHFDYHVLNDHLLKIDILGHDDPTGLRILHQTTNQDPSQIPFNDQRVIRLFSEIAILGVKPINVLNEPTGALGLPEYGTTFVRGILAKVQVKTFAGLIAVSGLSHGTNVWENNAKTLMLEHHFPLEKVIACRDDILIFLLEQGLTMTQTFTIMKKIKYGLGFTTADEQLLQDHQVPHWYIESCKKIGYLFPRAHATAYAIMAYRFAWFKLYFPHEFYAMYFTIRCSVFDLATMVAGPTTILNRYELLQKQLRQSYYNSKTAFSAKDKLLLPIFEIGLEMYARQIKLVNLSLKHSAISEFKVIELAKTKVIVPPFTAITGLGLEVAQRIVQARTDQPFTSQTDFKLRTKINQTLFSQFQKLGFFADLPVSRQKTFL